MGLVVGYEASLIPGIFADFLVDITLPCYLVLSTSPEHRANRRDATLPSHFDFRHLMQRIRRLLSG